MGVVRLGADGEVDIIEPCAEEEAAKADAAVIAIAERSAD